MSNKKEDIIADMDFGEMMDVGGGNLNINEIAPPEDSKSGNEEPPKPEEDELNLNNILEGEQDQKPSKEDSSSEEEKELNNPPAPDDKNSSTEPFALVFAKHLKERGILSTDIDEEELKEIIEKEGEDGALESVFTAEIKNAKESLSQDLDDYTKEYTQLREMGYSQEDASNIIGSIEEVDNLKEDQLEAEDAEDLRRQVMTQQYKVTTRFTDEKIKKLVQRSFDMGDDIEDSKEALKSLKDVSREQLEDIKNQTAQQEEQAKDNYKKYVESLNKTISDTKEIIPDVPINKQTKDRIKDMITKPTEKDENGNVLNALWAKRHEDPIKFDTTLAYLIHTGAFDGKWDKITKVATTKATSKLKDYIDNQEGKSGFHGSGRTPNPNSKDKQDILGPLKGLLT